MTSLLFIFPPDIVIGQQDIDHEIHHSDSYLFPSRCRNPSGRSFLLRLVHIRPTCLTCMFDLVHIHHLHLSLVCASAQKTANQKASACINHSLKKKKTPVHLNCFIFQRRSEVSLKVKHCKAQIIHTDLIIMR